MGFNNEREFQVYQICDAIPISFVPRETRSLGSIYSLHL